MSLRKDVEFSLEVHGDIEFYYQNQHYFIGYNNEKTDSNGYSIWRTPNNRVAISESSDWLKALDEPIFDGRSINDVFDKINFTLLV